MWDHNKEIIDYLFDTNDKLFDRIKLYIASNCEVEDIFSKNILNIWALQNGYEKNNIEI